MPAGETTAGADVSDSRLEALAERLEISGRARLGKKRSAEAVQQYKERARRRSM